MHFIALVGTNASKSHNRKLLQFMQQHFSKEASISLAEIKDYPLFCEDYAKTPDVLLSLAKQIEQADGVIISTAEYDHDIPAALKSVLEWLSWQVHPLTDCPVMLVGASLGNLGSVYAQDSLTRILNAPGLTPYILPGHQFLLSKAAQAFDEQGNLTDKRTLSWLETCFDAFITYAAHINQAYRKRSVDAKTSASSKADLTDAYEINGQTFGLINDVPDALVSASKKVADPVIVDLRSKTDALTSSSLASKQTDADTGASQNE